MATCGIAIVGRCRHSYPMEQIDLTRIPSTPGVYIYRDKAGGAIYVGKAKHLRRRVASYFRDSRRHTPKTRAMLHAAESLETLSTTTEKEALLLEASLIKKHRPRYNILLRDDKQYVLFQLTKKQDWPRLTVTRQVRRDGSAYFGPFTSGEAARQTWKAIHKVFPLRRCADRAFANRVRPCLYHFMGQCPGPCVLDVDREAYMRMVHNVEMLLVGRSTELLDLLRRDMEAASDALEFEAAAVLRNQIRAVERTVERQVAVLPGAYDMDVLGLAEAGGGLALCVLFIRRSAVLDKRHFFWAGVTLEEGPEVLLSFLSQYYGPGRFVPPRVLVPWDIPHGESEREAADTAKDQAGGQALDTKGLPDTRVWDMEDGATGSALGVIAELLSELRGGTVRVAPPRNATENQLVTMATENAREDAKAEQGPDVAALVAGRLGMQTPPVRIEAVDVSHTGGRATRVGLVVFENGIPAKEHYRTYAVADEEAGGDDIGVLARWAVRRMESGPPWPDLLLVDGGRGQLHGVTAALAQAGGAGLFTVASIAKARHEDSGLADRRVGNVGDRIFLPGRSNPVQIKAGSPELLFLQHIRDTVHDYAVGRHRKARSNAAFSGELLRMPGIGPATARLLWQHFSSVQAMAEAHEDDLAALPGIGKVRARKLRQCLQQLIG